MVLEADVPTGLPAERSGPPFLIEAPTLRPFRPIIAVNRLPLQGLARGEGTPPAAASSVPLLEPDASKSFLSLAALLPIEAPALNTTATRHSRFDILGKFDRFQREGEPHAPGVMGRLSTPSVDPAGQVESLSRCSTPSFSPDA